MFAARDVEKELDFYRSPPEVALVVKRLGAPYFESAALVVDAGAGDGALFDVLPPETRVGVELNPQMAAARGFENKDFLSYTSPSGIPPERVVVVSNPPFRIHNGPSKRTGCLQFMDQAITFAHTLVFVVPFTQRRFSRASQVPPCLHLIAEVDVGPVNFKTHSKTSKVAVAVQVWQVRATRRVDPVLPPCRCPSDADERWGFRLLRGKECKTARPHVLICRFRGQGVCSLETMLWDGDDKFDDALDRIRGGQVGTYMAANVSNHAKFRAAFEAMAPHMATYVNRIASTKTVSISQAEMFYFLSLFAPREHIDA